MTTKYSPKACVECGTAINEEGILSGDVGPFRMTVRGHVLEVPAMYVCTPCAGAVMVGEKESTVTFAGVAEFMEYMINRCADAIEHIEDDPLRGLLALGELENFMEVQFVMAALDVLKDEEGGLDFIPECDGHCGHEHEEVKEVTPADLAHLN